MKKIIFIAIAMFAISYQTPACRGTSNTEDGPGRVGYGTYMYPTWLEYEWFTNGEKIYYGGCCGGSPAGGTGLCATYTWDYCLDETYTYYNICDMHVDYESYSVTYCQEQACGHMLDYN